MNYIAVVAWTEDFRVAKYAEFETEAEANAHVGQVADRFPGAFVAEKPSDTFSEWLIDPDSKAVLIDPPEIVPVPEPRDLVAEIDALKTAIVKKGVVTEQEIEAERK